MPSFFHFALHSSFLEHFAAAFSVIAIFSILIAPLLSMVGPSTILFISAFADDSNCLPDWDDLLPSSPSYRLSRVKA